MVMVDPTTFLSSLTNIDFTITLVVDTPETVYKVVISVDVKSTFLFSLVAPCYPKKKNNCVIILCFSPLEK